MLFSQYVYYLPLNLIKEGFDVVAFSLINCAPYCFSVYNFNLFCLYDHNAPKIIKCFYVINSLYLRVGVVLNAHLIKEKNT